MRGLVVELHGKINNVPMQSILSSYTISHWDNAPAFSNVLVESYGAFSLISLLLPLLYCEQLTMHYAQLTVLE